MKWLKALLLQKNARILTNRPTRPINKHTGMIVHREITPNYVNNLSLYPSLYSNAFCTFFSFKSEMLTTICLFIYYP